jgi:acetoin utilization protein AcuB
MFRVHTIDGVIFNGPLESLILSEEVKRLEKSYTARKVIDRKASGGGKKDTVKNYSHAVKAYRDAVNINQEIEPILHAYTIMKSPVLSLDPGMNIVDAWNLFQSKGISHMPVLSVDKRIIGIVSDIDLMKYMNVINAKKEDLSGITINTIMTKKVITADRITDIRRIAKAMFEYHIGTIPIVDNAAQLIGIITRSDILYALIHYPPLSLWG